MARKVSKAGKGGGDALADLRDFLINTDREVNSAKMDVGVKVDAKAFNTYAQSMKVNLTKAYVKATGEIARLAKEAVEFNISNTIWAWPRVTLRKNGSSVSSPRDIVDTGRLLRSNSVKESFTVKGAKVTVINRAPYAGIVQYGGYVRAAGGGRTYMPPRPFLDAIFNKAASSVPNGVRIVPYNRIIGDAVRQAIEDARG